MFNFPGASGGFRGSCSSHNNRSPTLGHRRQKELSDTSRQDVAKIRLVITSQGVCWASTATGPVISSFSARQLDGNCNEISSAVAAAHEFCVPKRTCNVRAQEFHIQFSRKENGRMQSHLQGKKPTKGPQITYIAIDLGTYLSQKGC